MSFLKAIEEGKLAKKKESLQEPKKKIAKKKESSKDESFEQQYDNDPFEYTKQDLEANEKKVHAIYQAKIKELEEEREDLHSELKGKDELLSAISNDYEETISKLELGNKKLLKKLHSQEGSYNSQIEVMQQENMKLESNFYEALERIKDMTDLSLELEGKLNHSISPEQMADLRSSWNTEHFKEIAQLKKIIDNMNQDIISQIEMIDLLNIQIEQNNNKSPSEYVELLKNDQSKTELMKNLHDRMFKVKHKGKTKNYNSKYAIEIFRLGMEWRNLLSS